MAAPFVGGMPGIKTVTTANHRIVFRDGQFTGYYGGGRVINGTLSRDPDNTSAVHMLRAGLLMGKVTATGKYANSIMGLSNAAYAAGGVSLTVTSAVATELARRVGATGTFTIVGPPAASGIVNVETVTYSAISGTTVTVTALANSYISGSFIMPTDGSQDILTVLPCGYPISVFGSDMATAEDQPFYNVPIAGTITTANLINYPSDASLKLWLKSNMNETGNKWIFDDNM